MKHEEPIEVKEEVAEVPKAKRPSKPKKEKPKKYCAFCGCDITHRPRKKYCEEHEPGTKFYQKMMNDRYTEYRRKGQIGRFL